MAFGVTASGFIKKPLSDLLSEMATALKTALGQPGLNTGSDSAAGQTLGVLADQLSELWEVAEAIDAATDIDSAEGEALDRLGAIVGLKRFGATEATATLTVNLNAGVTLPAGQIVSADGAPTLRFTTDADATNSGGSPADIQVTATALDTGSVIIDADVLTVIDTPYSGWNSVTNDDPINSGRARETDTEYRLRIHALQTTTGSGTIDAIRADVASVETVESVYVINNPTDAVVDGVAAHSFEVVVVGADTTAEDNAIAQAIWDNRPAGIQETGTNDTGTATDTIGEERTIAFTRATEKQLLVEVDIVVNDDFDLTNGDDDIADALVAYIDSLDIGDDVKLSKLYGPINAILGIDDIDEIRIAFDPDTPSTSNLAVTVRQIARLSPGDVTVTHI